MPAPTRAFCLSPSDLTIVRANPAYLQTVGMAAEVIVGRTPFEVFPPNPARPDLTNAEVVRASIASAVASRHPMNTPVFRYDVRRGTPAGGYEERFWSTVHTPVLDPSGEVAFVLQNAIDVTPLYASDERLHAASPKEESPAEAQAGSFSPALLQAAMIAILRGERSYLESLFRQAPGFIAVLKGEEHLYELANDAYFELIGRSDVIGSPLLEASPHLEGHELKDILDKVFRNGAPYVGYGIKVSDPSDPECQVQPKYIDLLLQPIVDSEEAVTAVFVQGHDVSQTYKAKQQLTEKVTQLEAAKARQTLRLQLSDGLRKLSDPYEIFARSSELIAKHLEVDRILYGDYDTQSRLVTYHSNYTHGVQGEFLGTYPTSRYGAANFAALEDGTTWISQDLEHDPRTSAPDIWLSLRILGIYSTVVVPANRKGTSIGCLFVCDSKPHKWSKDEVALIEDFAERTWTVVDRVRAEEALREQNRRKDEFLAELAHELRNPIAPITAAAQLLERTPTDPEQVKRCSQLIIRQVSHMTAIVDDLLDVSRLVSGLAELAKEVVDVRDIVTDAIEQVRPLLTNRRQHFSVSRSQTPIYVLGNHKRLVQVLTNLLINASKYTPEDGKILLRVDTTAEHVELHVWDNGIGMSKDLLPKIFELFSQGERTADRSHGGLGLGLSIVKKLVTLHGGGVSAYSKGPNSGSEFTVWLPRLINPRAEKPSGEESDQQKPARTEALRVLLVDDNVDAAHILAHVLESAGHQVALEGDSRAALQRAERESFDAFVLDIGLPGIDGNELVTKLRALPAAKEAFIVALSGKGQQAGERAALNVGFDQYLVKPMDTKKLLTLLAQVRRRPSVSGS